MKLACIVFQFQDNATYPLCFDDSHNAVDLIVLPWIYRFVLCIEFEVRINGVVVP